MGKASSKEGLPELVHCQKLVDLTLSELSFFRSRKTLTDIGTNLTQRLVFRVYEKSKLDRPLPAGELLTLRSCQVLVRAADDGIDI